MSLTWPSRDPDEILDYQVDWTARLAGDTIATSTISLTAASGLTIDSQSNTTSSATVILSGGTLGQVAKLLNRVTTAGGRTMDEEITLLIDALTVEDGSGLASADSYISLAAADVYHLRRVNAAWTGSNDIKMAALRKATDYMGQVYRLGWAGTRVSYTQALDWPRYEVPMRDAPGGFGPWQGFYPMDAVPPAVAAACAELALKVLVGGDLTPDLGQAVKSETVGPISTVYQDYSTASKTYRAIDNLLGPLLANAGGIRVLRS